jgi:uncharacterized membrane protein
MLQRLRNILSFALTFFLFWFLLPQYASAQQVSSAQPKMTFMQATVVNVESIKQNAYSSYHSTIETLDALIQSGPEEGKNVRVQYDTQGVSDLSLHPGDAIILSETQNAGKPQYTVESKYRQYPVTYIAIAFIILVILIAGWKGLGSFIGLAISLSVIFAYVIPQILAGADPLTICMIGAVCILLLTTYMAHGFSGKTTIALTSTLAALFLTYVLSILFVNLSQLTGYTDENSLSLHFGTGHLLNLKGLLLGGIIIGTLGALNDVTTTQAATIFELAKTDRSLTFKQLFKKGLLVGREHVVSMINTLVLAYAGSSLSIFIFLFFNSNYYPLWVIMNSETLNEEIIRTIAGTMGLMLVVPVVTGIAAYYATKPVIDKKRVA